MLNANDWGEIVIVLTSISKCDNVFGENHLTDFHFAGIASRVGVFGSTSDWLRNRRQSSSIRSNRMHSVCVRAVLRALPRCEFDFIQPSTTMAKKLRISFFFLPSLLLSQVASACITTTSTMVAILAVRSGVVTRATRTLSCVAWTKSCGLWTENVRVNVMKSGVCVYFVMWCGSRMHIVLMTAKKGKLRPRSECAECATTMRQTAASCHQWYEHEWVMSIFRCDTRFTNAIYTSTSATNQRPTGWMKKENE